MAVAYTKGPRGKRRKRGKAGVTLVEPRWDAGAMGPANRAGLVSEPVTWTDDEGNKVNPNGVKRMRRVDMLETYYRRGWISTRGHNAGEALRNAWEGTEKAKGMDWSAERVDSTPKPDAQIDIRIDRVSRLISISKLVPNKDARIVFQVACMGNAIGGLREYRGMHHEKGKAHLRDALDRLADALEGRNRAVRG